jgi:hypothetical protein
MEDQPISSNVIENIRADINNSPSVVVHSATGVLFDATNTEPVSSTDNIDQLNIPVQERHLGYLSRFLILALDQLKTKHELRRTTIGGVYITKHELRMTNANSSLVRKVYITPSTILYEGPYREEKCPVTRHFSQEQDGFLRVSFRDEGQ